MRIKLNFILYFNCLGNSFCCDCDNIYDVGLGKQETYINCADITIVSSFNDDPTVGQDQPIVPSTTSTPTTTIASTEPANDDTTHLRQSTTQQAAQETTPEYTDGPVVNDEPNDDVTGAAAGTTLTYDGVVPFSEIQGIDVWYNNHCNLSSQFPLFLHLDKLYSESQYYCLYVVVVICLFVSLY